MAELEKSVLVDILKNPMSAISMAEQDYEEKVESVAKRIANDSRIRVLFLSGPSGSGKTTTANLISDKIKSFGEKSMVVSMDDFYRAGDDPEYPRTEDGDRDFESPYALDIPKLLKTLSNIIDGKPFSIPRYDFKIADVKSYTEYESFADGCVIIEGIHGLNPIFSSPFPHESVMKLFVSVSTNITEGGAVLISGRKMRFIRRLVRDSIYRGADAFRTIDMWEDVRCGEEKYLYPYKHMADMTFDTFHSFEPAVMLPFARGLITDEVKKYSEYAKLAIEALEDIVCEEYSPSSVPETSLIKEFIPGGIYESLY